MKAIKKLPGKAAKIVDVRDELSELQSAVGGYIETVTLDPWTVVCCDEEGRLKGLPYNVEICGIDFCGPVLLVTPEGDHFTDLVGAEQWLEDLNFEVVA